MVALKQITVDYEELASLRGLPVSDVRELHTAFNAGDVDRNGDLDFQEIHTVLECVVCAVIAL
jgi:Ca2+-binding EF-hand superfamily protein